MTFEERLKERIRVRGLHEGSYESEKFSKCRPHVFTATSGILTLIRSCENAGGTLTSPHIVMSCLCFMRAPLMPWHRNCCIF